MSTQLELEHDDWSLALRADIGGAVRSLHFRDRAVLRPSPPQFSDALQSASFALVPYANRIAHGRFNHAGRTWSVPLNYGSHPHALHGVGWQVPWQATDHRPDSIALRHEHNGGKGWPWPYVADQHIELTTASANFALSITSRAEVPMPVGLGFHPAFPARPSTVLRCGVGRVWLADADCLPTHPAAADHFADWRSGAVVQRGTLIDNCHEDWDRRLVIATPDTVTEMRASTGLEWLHVYVPPDADFFCAEPVSHLPDAVNRTPGADSHGLRMLQPGERFEVSMQLTVEIALDD